MKLKKFKKIYFYNNFWKQFHDVKLTRRKIVRRNINNRDKD